jgi:hypothetical protein
MFAEKTFALGQTAFSLGTVALAFRYGKKRDLEQT